MSRRGELDRKYTATSGRVFMNGTQALVRLPLVQMRRDREAGLETGAFVSGYRGSPLGAYDQQLQANRELLLAEDVHFQPGINEDLAATAVWGSQQVGLSLGARKEGVVGIWYGKGPGVDRSGDVFKHANAAGSSRHGGVLAIAGDDHGAKSSTVPHQSDHAFMAAVIPMLYPSSIHEFVEFGLLGIAMSRYSGCWVGMKVIADTVETTASVDLSGERREFVTPTDFILPPDGLNLRVPDDRWSQDNRLQTYKAYAAIAFARANRVDRVTLDSPNARLGIIASGKAYEDVRQALRELGVDEDTAHLAGLRLYKVGMPWPLEPEGVREFSVGLEEILVVEERREIIENQIKQQLFNWRADVRPRIIGKFDHNDRPVLSLARELTVATAAVVIGERILALSDLDEAHRSFIEARVRHFRQRGEAAGQLEPPLARTPFYCSGCPHNSSTKVPEGSRGLAGIGCHFMVTWMGRRTETFSQMGGEGVAWVGTAPFTDERHVFVNLGDGTYFHSGQLAIRQAVAAGVNATYKILYNDAVAMTGGQTVDGPLDPAKITHQLHREGVTPIWLVSEFPERYHASQLAPGTEIHHRDDVEAAMLALRDVPGVSAIVYDQTCASEKRRRRKRGLLPDPDLRIAINPAVCEGCGDCSVQSNCLSVEPLETEWGRKRQINQSTCNKDTSCLKGFCPSFVTLEGAKPKTRAARAAPDLAGIPDPVLPDLAEPCNIAITGVGGTGVLTIGAVLGMAAHLDGNAPMLLDMAGLAQKGGAVLSHVRIGRRAEDVTCPRIVSGSADVLIAADDVVATSKDAAGLLSPERTRAVVNTHLTPVAQFVRDPDFDFRRTLVAGAIRKSVGEGADFVNFTELAETVSGDAIATNIMMLGYAWQKGMVPVTFASLQHAIELNGVAVKANLDAFAWGRFAAARPDDMAGIVGQRDATRTLGEMSTDELVEHRSSFLTDYQDAALAARYRALVERARQADAKAEAHGRIERAVAENYAKLLAVKDEYEVARLHTDGRFERRLEEEFDGVRRHVYHFAPSFLRGVDANGRPKKRAFGPWILPFLRGLAGLKRLRGTLFDPFARNPERVAERRLVADYEADCRVLFSRARPADRDVAVELLSLPAGIRGFGPVKHEAMEKAARRRDELLALMGEGARGIEKVEMPAPAE
ncbi:indolepyruvate ferredoxin oxidoreductase family protein [Aureimonas phyllosphaerae]|uniref:Indolepyruvate ferredoxin oxidoreductase n=1 Tax=Aureimonas phyllosphaerae TaxID=1166078 RepID=A0A7W6FW63_9HYPH|nr:indolepyruvate ferredoxin oxidoreductase family protein [Aureimonas phyllosphaerae]MBB3937994.1 indolepyruvate ferredoxin oxidoreductase [Aureimonas phyllosphaerae]MBB3962001.1 indolepyruvate ferredoxin oxidoreductase [Aureimonas phyllosphaerae]SFF53808.1 indolepyruvate ferredoxin oxidoreductase [Aureimonas phyllosphaerae]